MDFIVEFYEAEAGTYPVREFLDELKASDPHDFAAAVAGLAKLRGRQYHWEPLTGGKEKTSEKNQFRPLPRRAVTGSGVCRPL